MEERAHNTFVERQYWGESETTPILQDGFHLMRAKEERPLSAAITQCLPKERVTESTNRAEKHTHITTVTGATWTRRGAAATRERAGTADSNCPKTLIQVQEQLDISSVKLCKESQER